ncbi:hypothetical protein L202_07217 [Cryptococcus amylolentus CBS 6039]|uniref:Uncharacterized protein n=2 Tax=Cryptococcus amylolentus TaxID=104669 RepID=A0A1E3HBF3_9TREE|nr:hypothetical protein L202_07217 [Cryptococcus amylolentus CBS 6039]ODN73670.1 hypothetical protein L202_07217 [Cryptococcus amylolentus CBS 6039]ODO00435.1 hypothetical protein I350_07076 [Cryptococcus amylolentus CBS 6273]
MPLFKLTSKRIEKRQREDELGITELKAKMREAGEEVPDSEDELSGEDSDEEDGSDDDEEEEEEDDEDEDEEGGSDAEGSESGLKRKRSGSESSLGSEEEEYDDEEDRLDLTPEEALQTPIYAFAPPPSSSDDEDVEDKNEEEGDGEVDDSKMQKLCALCPGKVMKNEHMVEMHLASNAHKRSAKRYEAYLDAHNPSPDTDPRTIALSLLPSHSALAPKAAEKTDKKKKNKSVSKKDRLTARLAKAQQSVSTTLEQQPEKLDAEKLKEVVEGKGLNRKARRALVARLKEEGRLVGDLGKIGEKGEKKEKPKAKKAKKD